MNLTQVFAFAVAILVAAVLPGPAIVAIVARVLGRGVAGAVALALGVMLGDVTWLVLVVAGLSVVAHAFGTLFLAVRYCGAAYLLFLAYRLWTAPAEAHDPSSLAATAERPFRLGLGGLALELGNPKTMVFFLALVPAVVDIEHVTAATFLALIVVAVLVLGAVFGSYILLAVRSRQLFRSPRAIRMLNRGAGTAMATAAVAVAAR